MIYVCNCSPWRINYEHFSPYLQSALICLRLPQQQHIYTNTFFPWGTKFTIVRQPPVVLYSPPELLADPTFIIWSEISQKEHFKASQGGRLPRGDKEALLVPQQMQQLPTTTVDATTGHYTNPLGTRV